MPAPLALVLCTVLVLCLVRVEWRASPSASWTTWIPTIWMLSIASKPLGGWLGIAGTNEGGSFPDQVLLIILGAAGLGVLLKRRFDCIRALRRHVWIMMLLGYMLISTIWSDMSGIALRRWIREAIVLIAVLVILSAPNPRQSFQSVLRRFAYILLPYSLLLIKYYPRLGIDYGRWSGVKVWMGVTVEKNNFGCLCMISSFFLFWSLICRWNERGTKSKRPIFLADLAVLGLSLFLLFGADKNSATAATSLAAGCAMFMALLGLQKVKLRIPQTALMLALLIIIGFGIATPFLGGTNVATFSSSLGRDDSLTGRTEVWAHLLPALGEQPLFGSGFGSFWTTERRGLYDISDGHNGYLDVMLDLGAVGLSLYMAWFLSSARNLHRFLTVDYDWAALGLCYLLMALVYNITESTFNGFGHQMSAMTVMVSLGVPYQPVANTRSSSRAKRNPRFTRSPFEAGLIHEGNLGGF